MNAFRLGLLAALLILAPLAAEPVAADTVDDKAPCPVVAPGGELCVLQGGCAFSWWDFCLVRTDSE